MDEGGRVLEFNRAAERTFGYAADEVVGVELSELIFPPDLRERYRRELEPRLSGEGAPDRGVELTAMCKDGSTLPVQLAVTRVIGSAPPIFAGLIRDLTDVRR